MNITNKNWLQGRDSNPRHGRYERPDLPTELPCDFALCRFVDRQKAFMIERCEVKIAKPVPASRKH